MNNQNINPNTIQSYLVDFAPTEARVKAAEWLVANQGRFTVDALRGCAQEERRNLGRAWSCVAAGAVPDKRATGKALWAGYCHFTGIAFLDTNANRRCGLDYAARKFKYADGESLAQHQPDLRDALAAALAHFEWRGLYFIHMVLRADDIAFALNTWWKEWSPDMDGRWRDLLAEREKASVEGQYVTYEPGDLFATVMAFMQTHRDREHTYNAVAKALMIHPKAIREIMAVKDVLVRLSDPAQTAYRDVVRYQVKDANGGRAREVFRWSPARRRLEAARTPEERDRVIKAEITAYLDAAPYQTTRGIIAHCRDQFGAADSSRVIACLRSLLEDEHGNHVLLAKTGARGAKLHYPNPSLSPQPGPGQPFGRTFP